MVNGKLTIEEEADAYVFTWESQIKDKTKAKEYAIEQLSQMIEFSEKNNGSRTEVFKKMKKYLKDK